VSGATNSKDPPLTEILNLKNHYHSRYSNLLRAGRSGDRIPVEARFSATIQTGSWAHPASYKKGTRSFPGGKVAGAWRWPSHLAPGLKKEYSYTSTPPLDASWCVLGWTLTFILLRAKNHHICSIQDTHFAVHFAAYCTLLPPVAATLPPVTPLFGYRVLHDNHTEPKHVLTQHTNDYT
jgi:hypothetical protein